MKTYAIMGVTGQVGGAVARHLMASGAHVRAIVRTAAAAQAWEAKGATAAVASIDDAAALQAAFTGADGAFIMTPTWFDADDMFAENRVAIETLGSALRAARPGNVVLLSSVGAQLDAGTGAIGKLHLMEQAFADLPALTSIRAAWFMENFAGLIASARATGALPSMLAPLDRAIPMVAIDDIGAVAAQRLQAAWTGQHVIELEGPQRYSPDDVAAAFTTVLARPVAAQPLQQADWPAVFRTWGMSAGSSVQMAAMVAGFNSGHLRFAGAAQWSQRGTTTIAQVIAALASH